MKQKRNYLGLFGKTQRFGVQYITTEAENRNDLSASFSIDQSPDQSNPERPTGKVALTHLGLASAHCSLLIITTSVMGMMR